MKKLNKLALWTSLLSVAATSFAAAAPVTVRITGSSAYRAAVTNAIVKLLTPSTAQAGYANFSGSAATSLGGANQQIIHGFLVNAVSGTSETSYPAGQEVYFKTSWSGSLSGLIALTTNANTAQPFLSTSNITSSTALAVAGAGTSSSAGVSGGTNLQTAPNTPTYDSAQIADTAFSDVFASSTPYNSSNLVSAKTGLTGAANGGAPAGVVGVVPFLWITGVDSGTAFTNINSIQAQQLLSGGFVESQLTGVSTDSATNIFAVGRDSDSGTRFTAFAESGFSVLGFSNPNPTQYLVTVTGASSTSGGTVSSIDLYPGETLFGQPFDPGTQGYASGSGVSGALAASGSLNAADNPGLLIGYLGENDSVKAVSLGAHPLSFNGVTYGIVNGTALTFNRTLLDEGDYTFWGYEHEYYLRGNADASISDAVAKQVATTDAAIAGEVLKNMHVSRAAEGAPIAHN